MMKKIGLIFASVCLLLLFYCPDTVHAASTTVCLADFFIVANPYYPDINVGLSGDAVSYYEVAVFKWTGATWTLKYFTGLVNAAWYPGNNVYYIPPGTLEVDGSYYQAQVVVWNGYVWSGWNWGNFILGAPGVCGTANGGVSCSTAGDRGGTLCAFGSVVGMTAVNCGWYWQCSGAPISPVCKSFRSVPLGSCGAIPF
ncbi:MAG: hypothetical protein Q8L09_00425 [Candidatus Moranbacteria bacterium]|nr:hypothetical protein [Candidatus Moranbacteria bacterium]